jgi:thioredoxin 1
MLERFLILLLGVVLTLVALYAWRRFAAWRLQRLAVAPLPAEIEPLLPSGPALLYFTTATCAQCRYQQTPILAQLQADAPVTIHKLDAVEQEALARFFGILTVPTTVWIDQTRRPAAINHGLAPLTTLRQQAVQVGLLAPEYEI